MTSSLSALSSGGGGHTIDSEPQVDNKLILDLAKTNIYYICMYVYIPNIPLVRKIFSIKKTDWKSKNKKETQKKKKHTIPKGIGMSRMQIYIYVYAYIHA